jgi:hypothetical protein
MTQFHFTFSGVLEVDPDIVRVAAANALGGSDDPGSAGFQAGLDYRIGSAETALQLLIGSLMGSLSSHLEKAGAASTTKR